MRLQRRPRTTWLGRLVRGRRLDRNPLRRGADRAETAVLIAMLAAFGAAAPFAAGAAANWTSTASMHELQTERATLHQVRATLLETPANFGQYGTMLGPQATAKWTAPDGRPRTGLVTVAADSKAGSTTLIWTDESGTPVTPLRPEQIPVRADFAAAAAVTVLATLLLLVAVVVRRALDRRRMAAWEADWLATGPRWTTRR